MARNDQTVVSLLDKNVITFLEIIPNFDGNVKTLSDFLTSTEEVINILNQTNPSEITKSFILLTIKKKIVGSAKELISGISISSWKELKELLLQNYEDKRNEATLLIEMCDLKHTNEPILVFHKKFSELFLLYKSKIEIRITGNELKNMIAFGQQFSTQCFIKNCKEPYRSQLSARHPKTLGDISNLITNDLQYVRTQSNQPKTYQSNNKPVQYQTPTTFGFKQYQSPMSKYPQQQSQFPKQPIQGRQPYQPTPMSISTRTYRPNDNKTSNMFKPQSRPTFTAKELHNIQGVTEISALILTSDVPRREEQ